MIHFPAPTSTFICHACQLRIESIPSDEAESFARQHLGFYPKHQRRIEVIHFFGSNTLDPPGKPGGDGTRERP